MRLLGETHAERRSIPGLNKRCTVWHVGFVKLLEFLLWNRSHEKPSRFLLPQRLQLSWNAQDICCSKQLFRRKDYVKKVRCFLWGLRRKVFLKDWLQSLIVRIALSNINSTKKNHGYSVTDFWTENISVSYFISRSIFKRSTKNASFFYLPGFISKPHMTMYHCKLFNHWRRKYQFLDFLFMCHVIQAFSQCRE